MSKNTARALWARLAEAGLVHGERPRAPMASPWYVRVVLGLTGWIAAMLLLGVVGSTLTFIFEHGKALLVLGGLQCLLAVAISLHSRGSILGDQFAFATSIAGQVEILIGLSVYLGLDHTHVALMMAVLECILFFAIAGFPHRVWSAAAGTLALLYAYDGLRSSNGPLAILLVAFAWTWLNEFRRADRIGLLQPFGYGLLLVIAFLVATGSIEMGALRSNYLPGDGWVGEMALSPLIGGILVAAAVAVAVLLFARHQGILHERSGLALGITTAIVALATLWAPGIGSTFLAIVVGFAHSNTVLMALGGAGMMVYLGHFYYAMELSLLHKAVLLCVVGVVLLLTRFALRACGVATSDTEDRSDE